MDIDLTHLINDFKAGGVRAFNEVYNLFFSRILYFAKALIHNKEEAEDIVADTFVKLWKLYDKFETVNNIKAFLYITTRNACLNYLNSSYYKNVEGIPNITEWQISTANEVAEHETLSNLLEQIQLCLDQLPEQQKEIIKLILFEGLSDRQVAERIHRELKTVQNLKYEALNLIRKFFGKNGANDLL